MNEYNEMLNKLTKDFTTTIEETLDKIPAICALQVMIRIRDVLDDKIKSTKVRYDKEVMDLLLRMSIAPSIPPIIEDDK